MDELKLTNNPCSNEAVVVLKAHIKKLENQKAALDQKFRRSHTKEFLDKMSKLRHETLSLDALKEMDKIKDPHELSKALNAYKKRQNIVKKKLAQMEEEFAYWTCENIEKNNDEIAAIDLKIQQCEQAIMFVPKWP